MKRYIISESQFNILLEQPDSVMDRRVGINTSPPKKIKKRFDCVSDELSHAAQFAISEGASPFFVKYGLGILGRESDYGKIYGSYAKKAAPEYIMNKLSEVVPGFKSLLQFGAKIAFGKENWVPSMGIAQMTPDVAKKYGVNLEELMTLSGSLYAASRYLRDLYKSTSQYYDTSGPSKIIYEGKLISNPSSTGNAALDAAIMSYNLGLTKFQKQYCKTNNFNMMAPCDSPNQEYKPYPKDKPNLVLRVDPDSVVRNYVPNIKTDTTGVIDKGLNKYVRDTPSNVTNISSLGYLKEVVGYAKNLGCIK